MWPWKWSAESALNNAIKITRRQGHVVLFGVRNGDARIEDCHRVIMNGLQLHGVVGRRIFSTWETARNLLEKFSEDSEKIWKVILNGGQDTVVDIDDWEFSRFEQMISTHPKVIIRFAGA